MTVSRYGRIAGVSTDTTLQDLTALVAAEILERDEGGGRSSDRLARRWRDAIRELSVAADGAGEPCPAPE